MKTATLWALVALNVVLAIVLFSNHQSVAHAQARTRRGDYLMVPGSIPGAPNGVVFSVDTTNALVSVLTYDDASNKVQAMPPIDLNRVFAAAAKPGKPAAHP